jgi:DNA-directed RNA polymerase subunit K/omega
MKYTKYEKARLIGARALQLSMGAPILLKIDEKELESMKYDVVAIAAKEVESDVISFTIKRSMPQPTAPQIRKKILIENVDAAEGATVVSRVPLEDDLAE